MNKKKSASIQLISKNKTKLLKKSQNNLFINNNNKKPKSAML